MTRVPRLRKKTRKTAAPNFLFLFPAQWRRDWLGHHDGPATPWSKIPVRTPPASGWPGAHAAHLYDLHDDPAETRSLTDTHLKSARPPA